MVSGIKLIAELCQNHLGDESLLRKLIDVCVDAEVWGVKIQSFFSDDLSDEFGSDKERLKKAELSWERQHQFVEVCKANKLEPITSVYTDRYLPQIKEAGFAWVKFGSAQGTNKELIEAYVKEGFKTIVSTGGWELDALEYIHPPDYVLHCVSQYPNDWNKSNLLRMEQLRRRFPESKIGFSDHSDASKTSWNTASVLAVYLGAEMIERHVTVLPRTETKDGIVSLFPSQLMELAFTLKKSKQELLKQNNWFGLYSSPQDEKEKELIKRYVRRWK